MLQDLLKLCQMLEIVHFVGGYPVEPIDLHPSVRGTCTPPSTS